MVTQATGGSHHVPGAAPGGAELVGVGRWQLEKAPAGPNCHSPLQPLERLCLAGQQRGGGFGTGAGSRTCRLSEALHPLPSPPPPAWPELAVSLVSLPVELRAQATATQLDQEVSVQHSPGGRRGEGPVEGSPCALDTFSDPFPMRGAALPPFTERRHRGRKGVSRCLFSLPPRHHEAFGRDAKAWKIRGTQGMGAVTGPGLPELVRRLRRGVRWPPPSSALRSSSKRAASS